VRSDIVQTNGKEINDLERYYAFNHSIHDVNPTAISASNELAVSLVLFEFKKRV
jgi:hypothetical protein